MSNVMMGTTDFDVQAIIYDHTDLAKELIAAGADVNIKDEIAEAQP